MERSNKRNTRSFKILIYLLTKITMSKTTDYIIDKHNEEVDLNIKHFDQLYMVNGIIKIENNKYILETAYNKYCFNNKKDLEKIISKIKDPDKVIFNL